MRRIQLVGGLLLLVGLSLTIGPLTIAQPPIHPIFTSSARDGRLIGVGSDLQFNIWKPIGEVAYGLSSHAIRYQAGMRIMSDIHLPLLGRLTEASASMVDWPQTEILGSEGEQGLRLGLSLGDSRYGAFYGRLWPQEGTAPLVGYLNVDTTRSLELPYRLTLTGSSQMIFGMRLGPDAPNGPFQSAIRSLGLSLGDLSLQGRWGSLTNQAGLAHFIFTTGVPGADRSLTGDSFWAVTLTRTMPLYQTAIPLPLPSLIARFFPSALPIQLQGSFSFQATGVGSSGASQATGAGTVPGNPAETLFSWGIAARLSIDGVQLNARLTFTQGGETRFHVGF